MAKSGSRKAAISLLLLGASACGPLPGAEAPAAAPERHVFEARHASTSAAPLVPAEAEATVGWFATPLGWKPFRLLALRGREALNATYRYDVRVEVSDPGLDPATLLGTLVTAGARTGAGPAYVNGYVSQVDTVLGAEGARTFEITVVPWTWLLSKRANCDIFQQGDVPGVVARFLAGVPFAAYRLSVRQSYPAAPYFVQYRETDLNFLQRLVEQVGIVTYFEHGATGHELVLQDDAQRIAASTPSIVLNAEDVRTARRTDELATDRYVLRASVPGASSLAVEGASPVVRRGPVALEMFDFESTARDQREIDFYARLRGEERASEVLRLRATVSQHFLHAGQVVTLPIPLLGGPQYLVVSSSVSLNVGPDGVSLGLESDVELTPLTGAYRPQRVTPVPVIDGPQVALVVGRAPVEREFVKVHFSWSRDATGLRDPWIPITRAALASKGAVAPGTEVLVDFLEGDPSRPIVTGVVSRNEAHRAKRR